MKHSYPLFKGCTRLPTMMGVPIQALFGAFIFVAILAMGMNNLFLWGLLVPIVLIMRLITKKDDKKFRILTLWFFSKLTNRNKEFWGGSSYAVRKPKGIK